MDAPERSARRPLDSIALAHVRRRLDGAAQAPWLHGEVARRMVERLPIVKLTPQRVVDWGSFVGASASLLRHAYPQAQMLAVEPDAARRDATAAALAQPWWSPKRWTGATAEVVREADLERSAEGQGQLLWSNMSLHLAADPQAVMRQWQRALAIDGFLMFSTLGPGSLMLLSELYAAGDADATHLPFAPFVDMHDLGDMLLHAGFADPVMDQETITLTWPDADALLIELHSLGGNASRARHAGLRTPRWRQRLAKALQTRAGADGRIAMEFEIVYGHAFKPLPRPRVAAETVVPVSDLRAMARAPRSTR